MKLWKKIYLFTLIVFTLCINVGFMGIIYFTYGQMLEAEKDRSVAEYELMRQSMSAAISEMETAVALDKTYFARYIDAYNSYYQEDTQILGVVYTSTVGDVKQEYLLPTENGLFVEEEENTVIYVAQILDEKHEGYRVIMRRTLKDFDKMWNTLYPLYIGGGVVLSLGISMILAIVTRIMLKPLDKLEAASKQVQQENWSTRVDVKGKDELAQLGIQFNAMAGAIEESIRKRELQSQQKQELINNLAHEMNTPITSIQGFADYMRMSELSEEERQECLKFIAGESKRLKEISATLLQMAQMQDGGEPVKKESFSIQALCKKLETLYQKVFEEENILMRVDCEKDLHMQGCAVLIESLLRNLITNAGYAVAGKQDGWIEVKGFSTEKEIKLVVSDNGCGIKQEHLEQIFEPFYRVDKARSRENGGSGLGLPFCKRIVEQHNGQISVESELGKGTAFTITFTI